MEAEELHDEGKEKGRYDAVEAEEDEVAVDAEPTVEVCDCSRRGGREGSGRRGSRWSATDARGARQLRRHR